jgi:predicted GTPase
MREVARIYPPPKINGGRPSRIRFIRQTHTRPPHFGIFFSTTPDSLPDSYDNFRTLKNVPFVSAEMIKIC